jgi:thiamine pyrophosphokinase
MAVPFISARELDIFISPDLGAHGHVLFVLGGRAPDPGWLSDFAGRNSPVVWAVDSGAGSCRRSGVSPHAVIGDMDSAAGEDLAWARSLGAAERLFSSDKDLTDFQLALGLWEEDERCGDTDSLIVSGCFGGRFDHLLSAVNTFSPNGASSGEDGWRKGRARKRRCMIDDMEGIFFLCGGEAVELNFRRKPLSISLLPFADECRGVHIEGVRWPLEGAALGRNFPWAVSNEICACDEDTPSASTVIAGCEEGILAVYWCFA